jgi:regulator of Ty1 transposition protein 109
MSKHVLSGLLAEVLPQDVAITVRHVSTRPTRCEAIFSAPPGEGPDTTFCESHFLAVSIDRNRRLHDELLVFGLEVLVYTTDRLTTLFVSKADSTGYLHLLKVVQRVSLLRLVSTTFLSYLVQARQRPGVRLVVSLFARAQSQYLFPSSIDNPGKHVLDDRELIKWWCRVLDPIVREYDAESPEYDKSGIAQASTSADSSATAYLIVPACDQFETRSFFPNTVKSDGKLRPRWRNLYPLHQICKNSEAPPRCLVPRFPDDPKARFLVDLDGELPEHAEDVLDPKRANFGHWRSVKSLDQFWEMMSFRQECSAGRLVGFLWLIVNSAPPVQTDERSEHSLRLTEIVSPETPLTPPASQRDDVKNECPTEVGEEMTTSLSPTTHAPEKPFNLLHAGQTRLIAKPLNELSKEKSDVTGNDNPFPWPEAGRGEMVLNESHYKSVHDCLLGQDFENEERSIASTMAWIRHASSLAGVPRWGQRVRGTRNMPEISPKPPETNHLIGSGLIRKRKRDQENGNVAGGDKTGILSSLVDSDRKNDWPHLPNKGTPETAEQLPSVNVLNGSFIRKKRKA